MNNGSHFQLRCWNKNPSAIRSLTIDEIIFDEIQNARHTDQFRSVIDPLLAVRQAARLSRLWNNARVIADFTGGATGGHAPADTVLKFYRDAIPESSLRPVYWGGRKQRPSSRTPSS